MEWLSSDNSSTKAGSNTRRSNGWRRAWKWIVKLRPGPQSRPDLLVLTDEEPIVTVEGVRVDVEVREIFEKTKPSKKPSKQRFRVSKMKSNRIKRTIQPQPILRQPAEWIPLPADYAQETEAFVTAMDLPPENRSEHQEYVVETYFGRVVGTDMILKHEVVTQSEEFLEVGAAFQMQAAEEERLLRIEALGKMEAQKYCRRKSWGVTKPQGTGRRCERWL